jgi:hypothetical protein
MGMPINKVAAGGLPVTISASGYGLPCTEAPPGYGVAVTEAPAGGGLAVTGFAFGPVIGITAASVLETAAVNTTVGLLSVTGAFTGTPVFTLSDDAGGKFNISGSFLRTNALLDYETATYHNVTVAVSGTTPATASRVITILVIDVLEPVIVLTGSTVNEATTVGVNIGTMSLANTYTGTPVYTLVDDAGGKVALSGALLNVGGVIDYETTPTFNITVGVSGITPAAPNKTFAITVVDVLEPVILLSSTSVNEEVSPGTVVGALSLANAFTGTPTYTLVDSAGGKFAITGSNVTVAGALDYETASSHAITIGVSGVTPPAPNKNFTITVVNVVEPVGAWNPLDKATRISLSNFNRTVALTAPGSGHSTVRSVVSRTAGKWFFRTVITTNLSSSGASVGICGGATGLNAQYVGGDTPSVGYIAPYAGGIVLYNGGTVLANIALSYSVAGDVIDTAVDLDTDRIFFRLNNGLWNNSASADPVANIGGYDISTVSTGAPLFAAVTVSDDGTGIGSLTTDLSASVGAPAGYLPWNGITAKNIVTDYFAVPDAQWAQATLSISTNVLTSSTPIWPGVAANYIGKTICVGQAGEAGPQGGGALTSTITGWGAGGTQLMLAHNCITPLSAEPGVLVSWGTNSAPMFANFTADHQGLDIVLEIPTGTYLICPHVEIFDGVKSITVNGHGSTLAGQFRFLSFCQYQFSGHSGYTDTVAAGASFVKLKTPANVSKFVVGDYAMMSGLDLQHYGFPTNFARFDYRRITAIDSDTGSPNYGRVSFDAPLSNGYLDTWPLYSPEVPPGPGENQSMGGPATLYAQHPHFDYTEVVNDLTIAVHGQTGVSAGRHTFNNCHWKGLYGPFPSIALSVAFNNCTAPQGTMEVDKLVDRFTMTGCRWLLVAFQSADSIKDVVFDNSEIDLIIGTPYKFELKNGCRIHDWQFGNAYGVPSELIMADCIVDSFRTPGRFIQSMDGGAGTGIIPDSTMSGGVITVPAAIRGLGVATWAIPGAKIFFIDGAVGSVGMFTVTALTEAAPLGDIRVHTDWPSGHFPTRTYTPDGLWLRPHDAAICTVSNTTGCAEVLELSAAPAGTRLHEYTKRTYDASFIGAAQNSVANGHYKKIKVNVTTPYTGVLPTCYVMVFPGWGIAIGGDGSQTSLQFRIDLKTVGVRELDLTSGVFPAFWKFNGVVGGGGLDVLPSPGMTTQMWSGGLISVSTEQDIHLEAPGLWPLFTIEVLTDQNYYVAPPVVTWQSRMLPNGTAMTAGPSRQAFINGLMANI